MSASTARPARPAKRRSSPINARPDGGFIEFGSLAPILAIAGIGVLVCAYVNALSRSADDPSLIPFWIGMLLIALPIFYRLTGREASAGERLVLVLALGFALYLVKVMRDSPVFTFSDETVHAFNAQRIVESGALFGDNPILEVTPFYPGLAGAATALMSMADLGVYPAGVIVVGAARLLLMASLFLLFARVSGSARLAGLGVAIYAGNFNFLFWGAQFSYESLSLPLLLMLMMALAERESGPREALRAWAIPIVIAIVAIMVTHHLSSYALVGFLSVLAISYWVVHRTWQAPNPWPFAAIALGLALTWLLVVASATVGYLTPVLSNAIEAIGNTVGGSDPPRSLFEGEGPSVAPTPLLAKGLALMAVMLLAAGLPLGLYAVWRRYRREPFVILFAIAAVGFFGTLALRLAPPAWETGNRASEFLFVGLAFVLAAGCVALMTRLANRPPARLAIASAVAVVLIGGAIAGWPWDSQMAKPMRISADGRTLPSPSLSAAEWAARNINRGRFAASHADAALFLTPGGKWTMAGSSPAIEEVLDSDRFSDWELPLLRENNLRYVVADLRHASNDTVRGHFFEIEGEEAELKDDLTTTKFNKVPGVSRIYTNGAVTIFDLQGKG